MSKQNIIRAWKDPIYRSSLSEAERAALPPNPVGAIEMSNADLGKVTGARGPINCSAPVCTTGQCSRLACSQYTHCLCPKKLY